MRERKRERISCHAIETDEPSKLILECRNCGKLFFNIKSGELITFSPDNRKYNAVLDKNESNEDRNEFIKFLPKKQTPKD